MKGVRPQVNLGAPAGRYISFDSSHTWETGMQTYVVGVQTMAVGPQPPQPVAAARRHIYCDLAVRSVAPARPTAQCQAECCTWTGERLCALPAGARPPMHLDAWVNAEYTLLSCPPMSGRHGGVEFEGSYPDWPR